MKTSDLGDIVNKEKDMVIYLGGGVGGEVREREEKRMLHEYLD